MRNKRHQAVMGNKVKGQTVNRQEYRRLRNVDLILWVSKMELETEQERTKCRH